MLISFICVMKQDREGDNGKVGGEGTTLSDALCEVLGSGKMTSVFNFKMAVMVYGQYRLSELRWDAEPAKRVTKRIVGNRIKGP